MFKQPDTVPSIHHSKSVEDMRLPGTQLTRFASLTQFPAVPSTPATTQSSTTTRPTKSSLAQSQGNTLASKHSTSPSTTTTTTTTLNPTPLTNTHANINGNEIESDISTRAGMDEFELHAVKEKDEAKAWARKYDEAQERLGAGKLRVTDERYLNLKREFGREMEGKRRKKSAAVAVVGEDGNGVGEGEGGNGSGERKGNGVRKEVKKEKKKDKKDGVWKRFGRMICLGKH